MLSASAGLLLRYPRWMLVATTLTWAPVIVCLASGDLRQGVYAVLGVLFALLGTTFMISLPKNRYGRVMVAGGFFVWAFCFLIHPWIASVHKELVPMLDQIWDLQKFVVMFGLLMVSLDEHSAKAEYDALHDEMTGLANRRLFADRLQQALARARRDGSQLVIFNIDFDDFKRVNDTQGHKAGDELLCAVATRLRGNTREADTLARVGGDEFLLVVSDFGGRDQIMPEGPAAARKRAMAVREKFRELAEQPVILTDGTTILRPSLSIGFALFPDDAQDAEELCLVADRAMYEDKRRGQGQLELVRDVAAMA
ncbi:MAG: GGDEF domain-containing protein [Acidobacteriaceae bacterium]|nr:GGDEF domain-containing protein [Acidobacteriaceae bacterium]